MGLGEPPIAAAAGEVNSQIALLLRLIAAPGVEPVATFPTELDLYMSLFVAIDAEDEAEASQLIAFLTAPIFDAYLASKEVTFTL